MPPFLLGIAALRVKIRVEFLASAAGREIIE
jgi:hypothetical protein